MLPEKTSESHLGWKDDRFPLHDFRIMCHLVSLKHNPKDKQVEPGHFPPKFKHAVDILEVNTGCPVLQMQSVEKPVLENTVQLG